MKFVSGDVRLRRMKFFIERDISFMTLPPLHCGIGSVSNILGILFAAQKELRALSWR
jgi:hypothetical protein